jgi:oligopeptide/dipeptide ABC transporter ATP-binding protein
LTPILSVRDLTVDLATPTGTWPVLDAVSLELAEPGSARALVGESGGGKTLLARAVLRLLPPAARVSSGAVRVAGEDLFSLSERAMEKERGGAVGYVFQEPLSALDPVSSIGVQVAEAVGFHATLTRRQASARAIELLEEAGLPSAARRFDDPPHALSGGMRQRVLIAAALAGDPKVLIADEPTASLDPPREARVLDLLERLRRDRGLAILLITHDLRIAAERCDEVSVLYAGRIVEEGPAGEFRKSPRHPYSAALSACAGQPGRPALRRRLPTIAGLPPRLDERGSGRCAFAPRCGFAFARCAEEIPPFYAAGAARARCFLFAPDAA